MTATQPFIALAICPMSCKSAWTNQTRSSGNIPGSGCRSSVRAIDQRNPDPGMFPDERGWFVQADLHDIGQIANAMKGCVAVIHLGAIPSPYSHPDDVVFRNNTLATFSVFQAASLLGLRRIAFASSGSLYGTAWTPDLFFFQCAPVC